MKANTTERFSEGYEDGLHNRTPYAADEPAYLAGWIDGNEVREAAARARWLRDRARARG